jgi:aspartate aminotransferase/aminotransferase
MLAPPRAAAARAAAMPRSAIREIMALAAARPEAVNLGVGDPDMATPPHISAALAGAVAAGATHYGPNAGLPGLRAAVAERCTARWGRQVEAAQVVVTTGAVGALFAGLMALLDAGDELLVPDPGWPNYASICHLAGARAVPYAMPATAGFLPDPRAIRAQVGPRTKAVLINTPGNPSGAVFPAVLMRELAAVAAETGVFLVADEVYEDIVFEGAHVSAGAVAPPDRVVVISGASKSYAMTGWRLGWLVAPPAIAELAAGLQEPVVSCAPTMVQLAAGAALRGPQQCVAEHAAIYRRRRDLAVEMLGQSGLLPAVPHGAFYLCLDISGTGMGSLDFCRAALEQAGVAVVPGITFGAGSDHLVRVALTVEEEKLREGLMRLLRFIRAKTGVVA